VRPTPENAQDTAWAKGASILYVEDNETVRYQTEQMLRQLGMDPIVFTSGRKALDWVRAGGTAELLLTDLVLPGGMSGGELARMARRHRPDLRVVITTGYVPQGALAESGWVDFPILPKPYTRRALQAALQAVLSAHG
jgi:CheY-like chemotaxis protein